MILIAAPLASFTYADTQEQSTGTTLWQQFLVIAAIVGFLAAILQLWRWLRRRKLDQAQEEALRILAKQLDAEDTRLKAEQYEKLLLSLRSQVEREVPRQARSAYLVSRINALAVSIARDFGEYEAAKRELADLTTESTVELDASIREVVRREISPALSSQRRLQVLTVAAIGFVLVANLVPFNFYAATSAAFVHTHPATWYSLADPIASILWLTLVFATVLGVGKYALSLSTRMRIRRSRLVAAPFRRRARAILGIAVLGIVSAIVGLVVGSVSIREQYPWGRPLEVSGGLAVAAWIILVAASFVLAVAVVTTVTVMVGRSRSTDR